MKIESIFIIGAGNVGVHLANAFKDKINIKGIYSKNGINAKDVANKLNIPYYESILQLPTCDLVLICSSDDSIEELINQIPNFFSIAYTSGSVSLDSLPKKPNLGVFYPLQTFSKNKEIKLEKVPFFIEANNENLAQNLFDLAWLLSNEVNFADSFQRQKLHIAAVFINNFTNHLAYLAKEFLNKNDLDWKFMLPLLNETIQKVNEVNPYDAQTGPARRNDQKIIDKHLELLGENYKEIYTSITKSIQKTYLKK
ncbi:MAG: DUF2520 domain-containing protein [Flavobacteriia bacterium]|nr:DUF2520 domain-containing protein [Flavobacteriia bacterium]